MTAISSNKNVAARRNRSVRKSFILLSFFQNITIYALTGSDDDACSCGVSGMSNM